MTHQDNTLILIFSIVDDFCKLHLKKKKVNKRGPHYQYSDSKILKMIAIKYLSGTESDRSLIRMLKYGLAKGIFRKIPDHSRFNRRCKELAHCLVKFQKFLADKLGTDSNPIRILDSTPIPVVSYLRSNRSSSFPEASYGYCAAKQEKYYGFKLHMAITPSGIPTNFDLTAANISDGKMTEELIELYEFLIAIADKGYLDREKQEELERQNKKLITPYRKNQNKKNSGFEQKLINGINPGASPGPFRTGTKVTPQPSSRGIYSIKIEKENRDCFLSIQRTDALRQNQSKELNRTGYESIGNHYEFYTWHVY